MVFTWSKDLETGNPLIDQQHKQLIDAVNQLMDACSKGNGRAELNKTMKFLQDYTAKHFSDEEKLQVQYKYPEYLSHRQYHEGFKKVVAEIAAQLQKEGPSIGLVGKVNSSIGGWLVNHIKREDVKVAAHIRTQTVAAH